MRWSDPGDERAEKQSHKQTTNVRGVVGVRNDCPEEEVVTHKHDYTSQRSCDCGAWQRKLAYIKRSDESACNLKNHAGGANAQESGILKQAYKTCSQPRNQEHSG